MLFGFSNVPDSFQGYINKIFANKLDIFIVVYLNNILIYTKAPNKLDVDAISWIPEQL